MSESEGDNMSLYGSIIKAASDLTLNTINNYEARKAASKANHYNIEMWNAQNAYNTPAHQMELLKAAGLNPNLVAGSIGGSTAGSMPRAEVATPRYDNIDLIGTYQDIRQKDAMTQNLEAQADVARKNVGINEDKLHMEHQRLDADLLNASNEAHLKGVQYAILNNKLRASQNELRQSDLDLQDRELMRPYELQAVRRDFKYKGSGIYSSMRRVGAVTGAMGNIIGGFTDAGASHLSWHRSD